MTELRRRLESLPRGLRDGTWSQCEVTLRGTRLHFTEPWAQVLARQRRRLRRRLVAGGAGLALLASIAFLNTPEAQVAAAVMASLLILAALDGLSRDLRDAPSPYEFAVVDGGRRELELLRPDGSGVRVPVGEIVMFLLVADPGTGLFHVGIVVEPSLFLPWLHTRGELPAHSLTWLLAHLSGRPAGRLKARLSSAADLLGDASALEQPEEVAE